MFSFLIRFCEFKFSMKFALYSSYAFLVVDGLVGSREALRIPAGFQPSERFTERFTEWLTEWLTERFGIVSEKIRKNYKYIEICILL